MSEFSVVQENAERALALARETKAELERLRAENAALQGQIIRALDVSQRHGRRHSHEDPLIFATTAEIADVSTAEATGTDRTVPRGGHVHALGSGLAYATTTQLADVADAEANGSSPLIPRGDHVHKLGILTTKGDLISYSTLPARVGVGANSKVLMADSTATPGVAWTALNKAIVIHINGGGSVLTTGVKLYLPTDSELLKANFLYGYEVDAEQVFTAKLKDKRTDIANTINALDNQFLQLLEARAQNRGAHQLIEHLITNWSPSVDDIERMRKNGTLKTS